MSEQEQPFEEWLAWWQGHEKSFRFQPTAAGMRRALREIGRLQGEVEELKAYLVTYEQAER